MGGCTGFSGASTAGVELRGTLPALQGSTSTGIFKQDSTPGPVGGGTTQSKPKLSSIVCCRSTVPPAQVTSKVAPVLEGRAGGNEIRMTTLASTDSECGLVSLVSVRQSRSS